METGIQKSRNSNIELLRIFCMFVIIMHHAVLYSGTLTMYFTANSLWSYLFGIGGKLGANCFFAISAYYLLNKKFSLRSVLSLHNTIWLYSVLFFALNFFAELRPYVLRDIPETVFPVLYNAYWFCSTYIAMLFFAPFLNIIIEHIGKKKHALSLLIIGGGIALPATLLPGSIAFKDNSHIGAVLVIYFLVAYMEKYLEVQSKRKCASVFLLSCFIMWSSGVVLSLLGSKFGKDLLINNSAFWMSGESVFMILAAVSLLWLFLLFPSRENSMINKISRGTIDVYLIHMNHFVYMWLWNTCFRVKENIGEWWYPAYVVGCSLLVLICGLLIGNIRTIIWQKISCLLPCTKCQELIKKFDGIMNGMKA